MIQSKANGLKIGGHVEFSTVDYPDMMSNVVFLSGCPLNCRYCSNKFLQSTSVQYYFWQEILQFLNTRRGLLDACTFSGGEPLLQADLLAVAMEEVRALDFNIGLHTSGIYPDRLKQVINYVDWVGLDIKAPIDRYSAFGIHNGRTVLSSLKVILEAGIDLECRTTVDPRLISKEDVIDIAKLLRKYDVQTYVLQAYVIYKDDTDPPPLDLLQEMYSDEDWFDEVEQAFGRKIIRR